MLEQAIKDLNKTHERVGRFVAGVLGTVLIGALTVVLLVYQNKERIGFMESQMRAHSGETGHAGMIERVAEVRASQREDRAALFTEIAAIRSTLDEIKAQLNQR